MSYLSFIILDEKKYLVRRYLIAHFSFLPLWWRRTRDPPACSVFIIKVNCRIDIIFNIASMTCKLQYYGYSRLNYQTGPGGNLTLPTKRTDEESCGAVEGGRGTVCGFRALSIAKPTDGRTQSAGDNFSSPQQFRMHAHSGDGRTRTDRGSIQLNLNILFNRVFIVVWDSL